MSVCNIIKNGFMYTPGEGSTYCCEGAMPGYDEEKRFALSDWDAKREYELARYAQSKAEWLSNCMMCKHHEDLLGESMRTRAAKDFIAEDNTSIVTAVIKTSDTCNLACRMCAPSASTKWQSVIRNNPDNPYYKDATLSNAEITSEEMEYLKEYVLTDQLRNLLFSGGETMLSAWNTQILEHLIDNDYCKNISCHFTTNGTIKFRDTWLQALKSFESATIEYSIDGYGNVLDYIRPGHTWSLLEEVVEDAYARYPDVRFEFNYVAQALNAHSYHTDKQMIMELFNGKNINCDEFDDNLSVCASPDMMSYVVICPALRDKYNISHLVDNMDYDPDVYVEFMQQMAWNDRVHKTSLEEHNPDFFNTQYYPQELINEYFIVKDKGFIKV